MKKLLLFLTGFSLTVCAFSAESRSTAANPFPYGSAAYWDWANRHFGVGWQYGGWYGGAPDFGSKGAPLTSPEVPLLNVHF